MKERGLALAFFRHGQSSQLCFFSSAMRDRKNDLSMSVQGQGLPVSTMPDQILAMHGAAIGQIEYEILILATLPFNCSQ